MLLLASTVPAFAAMSWFQGKAPTKHDLRAEVEEADNRWRTAQANNDIPAMEKLLSDDYLGISGNGQVLTKAQQLDRMRTHMTLLTRLDLSDEKVKLLGSIAIVTSQADLEGTIDGRPVHGSFRSTRVYKHVGGAWQLTSFEGTPERERGEHAPEADG